MSQAHSNSADVTPEGHLVDMVVRKGEARRVEIGAFVVQVHGTCSGLVTTYNTK